MSEQLEFVNREHQILRLGRTITYLESTWLQDESGYRIPPTLSDSLTIATIEIAMNTLIQESWQELQDSLV